MQAAAAPLRVARRWLACHERIAGLLGVPVHQRARQVRAALGVRLSSSQADPGRRD